MRPNAVESLRTIQAALAEHLAPELTSIYAQDMAQGLTMLLESLANEADTAAEDMRRENEDLRRLLGGAHAVTGNVLAPPIVRQVEAALEVPVTGSVTLSDLSAENQPLRGALEGLLVALEAESACLGEPALSLRRDIYAHLREGSIRGWSLWDMMSFREKMVAVRAARAGDRTAGLQ